MFGKRLKELRQEKRITQRKLAVMLEVSQAMIALWENNKCEPTETYIRRTALIFDVTTDYLLGLEDDFGCKINKSIVNSQIHNSNVSIK